MDGIVFGPSCFPDIDSDVKNRFFAAAVNEDRQLDVVGFRICEGPGRYPETSADSGHKAEEGADNIGTRTEDSQTEECQKWSNDGAAERDGGVEHCAKSSHQKGQANGQNAV